MVKMMSLTPYTAPRRIAQLLPVPILIIVLAAAAILVASCSSESPEPTVESEPDVVVATATAEPEEAEITVSKDQPLAYAQALVQQAIDRHARDGREEVIAFYNSDESLDDDWHVFILDEGGYIVSMAAFPSWVGVHDSEFKGHNHYPAGQMVIDGASPEGIQIDYLAAGFLGRVELKHLWVVEHEGLIFGSSSWSSGERSKSDQPQYTQDTVRLAIGLYDASGLPAALEYYNSVDSVDEQWYAFIVDTESGRTIGHFNPDLRDRDPALRVDSTGYFYGDDLLGATEEGSWVQYVITNPDSGEEQLKHTWAVLHDGYIFASGWYEES